MTAHTVYNTFETSERRAWVRIADDLAGGEDNGDAHLENLLVHHQVILPVTDGRLASGS